jgi:riboflavin kinase/FMN adenylyltransferase
LRIAAEKRNADKSAVWTFSEPSSRTINGISLLTDPAERFAIFRELGIDLVFLADFESVRRLDKETFAKEILYKECHVRTAVCGFNFRYGAKASGNAETLKATFSTLHADVEVIPPFTMNGMTVSSSEIRAALSAGEVEMATEMLARPYSITTEISHGKKLGRTLGFPTANQMIPPQRAVPRFGVYAVRMTVDGRVYHGVANVGVRPTVENTDAVNCETYLFDFDGNLYGKTAKTEFLHFIRGEKRFFDVFELKSAVEQNISEAKAYFSMEKEKKA